MELKTVDSIMAFLRLENPELVIINNIQLWPPQRFGFMIEKNDYILQGLNELKRMQKK